MSSFFWSSTSSTDPTLGANWTKSDGTTGNAPGNGDDATIAAIPGVTLASIAAADMSVVQPPPAPALASSSTGGGLSNGTYQVAVAYVNTNGITTLSPSASIALTGGTSTQQISGTVGSALPNGVTGINVYAISGFVGTGLLVGSSTNSANVTSNSVSGSNPTTNTAAIILNSLTVSQTFTGTIGTAATSGTFGYWKIGAAAWRIGTPSTDGTTAIGSGRIKIDFGSAAFVGTVLATGASIDPGLEPVRVKGTNSGNKLYVLGGRVGVATSLPGESATLAEVDVTGSTAVGDLSAGVTWTNANAAAGGTLTLSSGSSGALSVSSGSTATVQGAGAVATVNAGGPTYLNNRPTSGAAVTTLNVYGTGTADFSQNPAAVTVTTVNHYKGGVLTANAANPSHLTVTNRNLVNCGSLTAN